MIEDDREHYQEVFCLTHDLNNGTLDQDLKDGKKFFKIQIQVIAVFDQQFKIIKLTEVSTQIKIWLFNSEKKLL
jgi:hypothetical protein